MIQTVSKQVIHIRWVSLIILTSMTSMLLESYPFWSSSQVLVQVYFGHMLDHLNIIFPVFFLLAVLSFLCYYNVHACWRCLVSWYTSLPGSSLWVQLSQQNFDYSSYDLKHKANYICISRQGLGWLSTCRFQFCISNHSRCYLIDEWQMGMHISSVLF